MAFVHCHGCNWEQDDFWDWGYNPIRCLWACIRDYAWPKICIFDPPPHSYGRVFSWIVLWKECGRVLRRVPRQVWWTYNSWKRATAKLGRWPHCPKCDSRLCID